MLKHEGEIMLKTIVDSFEACPPLGIRYYYYIDENGQMHCCLEGAKIPENWKKIDFSKGLNIQ